MKYFFNALRVAALFVLGVQIASAELLVLFEGDVVNTGNASIALDSSGNGNHGLFQGDGEIEIGAGVAGNALGFPDTGGTTMRVNPAGFGAFDTIAANQSFTVGFWLAGEESAGEAGGPGDPPEPPAVAPRNNSVFWGVGVEGETDRAFQSHLPWSNGNMFFDVGGCCNADQRVNGPVERELWDSEEGDEWTHWTFTVDDFGDAFVYANGEELFFREGPTALIPELQALWVGSGPNAGNRFSGRMDDFFITDDALPLGDIESIISDGAAAFFETSAPGQYTPTVEVTADLGILDGQLAGSVSVDGAEIGGWSIDEVVRIQAGGTEVVEFVSLAGVGVAGDGTSIGDELTLLGEVPLSNSGADDVNREFRLNLDIVNSTDQVLGATFTETYTETIVLAGSGGGGGVDPFTLLGDLNQDGQVAFADFLILSGNFGAVRGDTGTVTTPEPSGLFLAVAPALGMGMLLLRRRRS